MTHYADTVHCQVVSVLGFLQKRKKNSSQAHVLVHSIYVAAISACHALVDWVSVGKYPLVAHFIRGAKRVRPPTRATVHLRDVAIVLEVSLELVPVRFLTLKMYFFYGYSLKIILMAITSLKIIFYLPFIFPF